MKWTSWQNLQKSLNNYGFKLADKAWRDGYSRWQGPDAFHKNSTRQELESIKRVVPTPVVTPCDIFVPLGKTPAENDEREFEKNSARQELESIKHCSNSGGGMDIFVPLGKTPTENDECESELLASFGESDEYSRLFF